MRIKPRMIGVISLKNETIIDRRNPKNFSGKVLEPKSTFGESRETNFQHGNENELQKLCSC